MELLLNLVWLMLAVPALILCWRAPVSVRGSRLRPYLFLSVLTISLLALLFPVVSVSDDLNAMRVELEESGPAGSLLRSATSRPPASHRHANSTMAAVRTASPHPENQVCGEVSPYTPFVFEHVLSSDAGERAPPAS